MSVRPIRARSARKNYDMNLVFPPDCVRRQRKLPRYGNVILPFVDHFPRDTELYRLLTTKPDEVRREAKA